MPSNSKDEEIRTCPLSVLAGDGNNAVVQSKFRAVRYRVSVSICNPNIISVYRGSGKIGNTDRRTSAQGSSQTVPSEEGTADGSAPTQRSRER